MRTNFLAREVGLSTFRVFVNFTRVAPTVHDCYQVLRVGIVISREMNFTSLRFGTKEGDYTP